MINIFDGIKKTSEFLTNMRQARKHAKQLRSNALTVHNLLRLECQRNLALLSSIQLEKSNKLDLSAAELVYIIESLEAKMLEIFLSIGEMGNAAREVSEDYYDPKFNDEEVIVEPKYKTPLAAAQFIYVKLHALKILITAKAKNPGNNKTMKNINVKPRLKNLQTAMQSLAGQLKNNSKYTPKFLQKFCNFFK